MFWTDGAAASASNTTAIDGPGEKLNGFRVVATAL
jgi:hypothetical protein